MSSRNPARTMAWSSATTTPNGQRHRSAVLTVTGEERHDLETTQGKWRGIDSAAECRGRSRMPTWPPRAVRWDPTRWWSAWRRTRIPAGIGSPGGTRPPRSRHVRWDSSSGSMIFSCSMIEPGHPWVTISGSASRCWEPGNNTFTLKRPDPVEHAAPLSGAGSSSARFPPASATYLAA